jgi:hypothetical protein
MKKQIPILITTLSLIIAIVGLSFGISATRQKKATEEEANRLRIQLNQKQPPANVSPISIDAEPPADTNTLAELEAGLAALRAELAAAKEQPPQRESWEDRMACMKEEDPEGYAEMIKNRTERRDAIRYDLAERTANFMELDSAFMTAVERENHDLLIEKMATVWALTEQFNDPEQPPNREAMRELFGAINEARPLMDAERTTMFRQLANDLGYDGEEVQDFSSYVEDIISATTIQMPRGGRRGGP